MVGIGYEAGSRFSLEFDVMYMPKGVKFQGSMMRPPKAAGQTTFDSDMAINEISVPVFIKMKILPGSTPFIFGGGEIGYVLSSKLKYSYTYNGETQTGERRPSQTSTASPASTGSISAWSSAGDTR